MCHAPNTLTRHAKYNRYICTFSIDEIEEIEVTILRLKCNSCNSTHAILPTDTVPYAFYSFTFIFKILVEYFNEDTSTAKISNRSKVSHQTIYWYIAQYIINLCSSIYFLRIYLMIYISNDSSPKHVLEITINKFSILEFVKKYFIYTKDIFLVKKRRNILSGNVRIGI